MTSKPRIDWGQLMLVGTMLAVVAYSALESVALVLEGKSAAALFPLVVACAGLPFGLHLAFISVRGGTQTPVEAGAPRPELGAFAWILFFVACFSTLGVAIGSVVASLIYVRFGTGAAWRMSLVVSIVVAATLMSLDAAIPGMGLPGAF